MSISDKTIVTGTDRNLQHYLPWWMDNVKANYPDINITICDFGMDKNWSEWAEKVSDEFIHYGKRSDISWFYKPQTLMDSTFKYKCWMDIDCQVVGDISNIFEFVEPGKIAAAPDNYHSWGCKFQSGVFAVVDKPDILNLWAEACQEPKNRGDQEILWDLVKHRQTLISLIPEKYNWPRLALAKGKDNDDKRIIHWTGHLGKKHIEQLIKK